MGGEPPPRAKNLLIPPYLEKFSPGRLKKTNKNSIFSCSHCSFSIFVLISYSLNTQVMFIFILIDAQYSQKAVFSFEKGSNRENHSSSGSLHPVKKFTLVTFLIPPQPFIAIWKTPIYKFLWPLFVDGCNCLKAIKSHYEETVYFLPEVPGTH